MGRTTKIWFGFGASAAILAYLSFHVEWHQVGVEIARAAWWPLIPVSLLWLAQFVLRAHRWQFLLGEGMLFSLGRRFDASMVGNLANFFLPLRAGEVIRPWALVRGSSSRFSGAFSSVVIERFFDLAAVLLCFSILLAFAPEMPNWVFNGAAGLAGVAGGIFIVIGCASGVPQLVRRVVKCCTKPIPFASLARSIETFAEEFIGAASVLKKPSNLLHVLGITIGIWAINIGAFWGWLLMFEVTPSLLLAIAASTLIALAVAAPSSPGFLGVYQAGCIAAFVLVGESADLGMAYALLTHLHSYLIVIVLGLYSLARLGLSVRDLRRAEEPLQAATS